MRQKKNGGTGFRPGNSPRNLPGNRMPNKSITFSEAENESLQISALHLSFPLMTLKQRNRLITILIVASIAGFAISAATIAVNAAKSNLIPPPETIRPMRILSAIPFTPVSFAATALSCALLVLSVPAALFIIERYLNKTKATEIGYFIACLVGISCETARMFVMGMRLWQTFSDVLLMLGRIILFGRVLTTLSFVFASVLSETSQRQDNARNMAILFSVSVLVAMTTPLNTARILSTGMVTVGFPDMFRLLTATMAATSIAAFVYKAKKHDRKEFITLAIVTAVLFTGYATLTSSDCYATLILGAVLFCAGIFRYIRTIHALYLWN